jgi:hypothetical protein
LAWLQRIWEQGVMRASRHRQECLCYQNQDSRARLARVADAFGEVAGALAGDFHQMRVGGDLVEQC